MMIFQDYTEYLVRHKLYREALAAGRKTMPVSKSKENILQPKSVDSQLKPQEPEPVATEIGKKCIIMKYCHCHRVRHISTILHKCL